MGVLDQPLVNAHWNGPGRGERLDVQCSIWRRSSYVDGISLGGMAAPRIGGIRRDAGGDADGGHDNDGDGCGGDDSESGLS